MTTDRKVISGIEFEAVRVMRPIPHWRAKVVETGYVFEPGIYNGESRPKLWGSIEYMAKRLGEDRFAKETLEAA
jgi:hypothetical protein